jgi:plastocyanin
MTARKNNTAMVIIQLQYAIGWKDGKMKRHLLLKPALMVCALMLASCASAPPATTASSATAQPAPSSSSAQNAAVSIENFEFVPATLTITAGTTVVWTNHDSAAHTIKSAGFSSQSIAQGQAYEFTFDAKGTYEYSCGIHPAMTGKIIVQ